MTAAAETFRHDILGNLLEMLARDEAIFGLLLLESYALMLVNLVDALKCSLLVTVDHFTLWVPILKFLDLLAVFFKKIFFDGLLHLGG